MLFSFNRKLVKMRNKKYWHDRFSQLEQSQNQKGIQCYADIERQYRQAQKQLEGQIAAWYQRFADNNGVTMQEARRMLTNKELAELKWDIDDYIRYGEENAINGTWMKQLENASARYHINRLEALKLQTQQSLEVMFGNQLDSIDSTMRDVYKSGYYHTAFEIQKGIGIGWDFATLDEKTISKVINKPWAADGKNFSERIWGNRQKLVNELHTELTRNIILGQDPKKAINNISKKMNVSKNVAGRLVMTEQAFFHSVAQKDCFDELDVEQYEIVATLDSHTSEICREMDGKHFPMSQWEVGATAPPFHVRCRSTTVPYFDDEFDSVGERAARDENGKTYYVPGNMTYKEWQKSFEKGDKSKTNNKPMEKSDSMRYTKRTKEQYESVANDVKLKITDYVFNKPKWSGNINIKNYLEKDNISGQKEWTCDISIIDSADDGVIWHEMLHSCSASYYAPDVYIANQYIEEASVEFLKQQICIEKEISHMETYPNLVLILQEINGAFHYGSDMEFAKELFNIPLPDRYRWLEDKVVESLKKENVSSADFKEVLSFVRILKGGENG